MPVPAFPAQSTNLGTLLLAPGQAFYVPEYQRDFSWGPTQIDRLFEDLLSGIARRLASERGPATFLGTTILFEGRAAVYPRRSNALPTAVLHVVDGQQRLTATLLVVVAIEARVHALLGELQIQDGCEVAGAWVVSNLRQLQRKLQSALWIDNDEGDGPFKLKPRLIRQADDCWGNSNTEAKYNSDIAWIAFETARIRRDDLGAKAEPALSRSHLRNVLKAIDLCLDDVLQGRGHATDLADLSFISDLSKINRLVELTQLDSAITSTSDLSDHQCQAIRLAIVCSFLLHSVVVVDVRPPDEDTAFALFEPLNTTGLPLTAIETLKPLVVKAEGGSELYAGSESAEAFRIIEGNGLDDHDEARRAKFVAELLTTFRLVQEGTRQSSLVSEQRKFLRTTFLSFDTSPPDSLVRKREFLQGLAGTGEFLRDVWHDVDSKFIYEGSDADRLNLMVLKKSDHTISLPLLIRYFERAQKMGTEASADDFRDVLRAIASFWVIWRSSRATTSGIDEAHRDLLLEGMRSIGLAPLSRNTTPYSDLPPVNDIRKALRKLLASKIKVTDASSWATLVGAQPIYQTAKAIGRYIILAAHHDVISDPVDVGHCVNGTGGVLPSLRPAIWESQYTVEHIAPQRPALSTSGYDKRIFEDGLTDRLGNLTLLPGNINTLLGNRSWTEKRDIFEILSCASPAARLDGLRSGGYMKKMSAKSRRLLESADYLPFCGFVAKNSAPVFSADYVRVRGERMAKLAWDRLFSELEAKS